VKESRSLALARIATVAWGLVLLPIAIQASHSQSVLETGLTIASIPSGVLLGVFLLGVLTRKPREGAAMAGVAAGLGAVLFVVFATGIAFTWYVPIGALATFLAALAASWCGTDDGFPASVDAGAPVAPDRRRKPIVCPTPRK
jgi:Na+/proline symporter